MTQVKRNLWMLENVDEETKRKIKGYAGRKGLTIAEALKLLIDQSEAK